MKTVVIDLEMNQPSHRIIQIGAIAFDARQRRVTDEFSVLVNPEEEVADEIVELTGLDPVAIGQSETLSHGLGYLFDWARDKGSLWVAWGSDIDLVLSEAQRLSIEPNRFQSLNMIPMARLLRCSMKGSARRGGLLKTMNSFNLEFEGRQHDALVDARNTARLLGEMINRMRLYNMVHQSFFQ